MLEAAGVPTVVVVTAPFLTKARLEAGLFGLSDLSLLALPHLLETRIPIGQAPPDRVRSLAADTIEEVISALTNPLPAAITPPRL
jgi:hypothetical protein